MSNVENAKVMKQKTHWRNIGILISLISVVVLIITMGISSFHFLEINTNLVGQLNQINDRLTRTEQTLNHLQLSKAVSQVSERTNYASQIDSAKQLVLLANAYLKLENNLVLALQLLQSAEKIVSPLDLPELATVKKILLEDISLLKKIPTVSKIEIYERLEVLKAVVDQLPLIRLNENSNQSSLSENHSDLPWWKTGLLTAWAGLQKIVIIKKMHSSEPFVLPDQKLFFYQNLKLQITQAEWALLQNQQKIYELCLTQVENWIKQYVEDGPNKREFLLQINAMMQIDVYPNLPDVTHLLQAFQDLKL